MRRIILLTAVVIMATASSFAQTLKSGSDSLSYAAGMSMTEGLLPYLKQNFGVDSTHIADFVRGFQETANKSKDTKFKAYAAGFQIANMVETRMLPDVENQLKDTPDQLNGPLFYQGFADALNRNYAVLSQQGAETFFRERMEANKEAKAE